MPKMHSKSKYYTSTLSRESQKKKKKITPQFFRSQCQHSKRHKIRTLRQQVQQAYLVINYSGAERNRTHQCVQEENMDKDATTNIRL